MQKYRTYRLDMAEHKGKTYGLARTILYLASKPTAAPYVIVDADGPNPKRLKIPSLAALRRRLKNAAVHEKFDWVPDSGPIFRVRKMAETEEIIDTTGTDAIDEIWTAVFKRFDFEYGIVNLGICANKPGEHSKCNAVDIGVSKPKDSDAIHTAILDIAEFLRGEMIKDTQGEPGLPVNGIIVMEQVCSRSESYWHYYSGVAHVSHVHVSGWPNPLPGWI